MQERKLIYVASPYGSPTREGIERNLEFVKKAGKAVIAGGHSPVIVHMMYPALLDDDVPEERALGCAMDLQILELCHALAYYAANGVSRGMDGEIRYALERGIPVYRLADIGSEPVAVPDLEAYLSMDPPGKGST